MNSSAPAPLLPSVRPGCSSSRPCPLCSEDRPMSHPPAARPTADRNLLFGVLALQLDFITRDALVAAMNAWVLDKARPLGQILVDRGALGADHHPLLEA